MLRRFAELDRRRARRDAARARRRGGASGWPRRGCRADEQTVGYQVDVRYHGQGFEIPVDVDRGLLDSRRWLGRLGERFDAEHDRLFSFLLDVDHELVNARATVTGPRPDVAPVAAGGGRRRPGRRPRSATHRSTSAASTCRAGVYDRARLRAGDVVRGPAIVTEMDSTTLVLPGHAATVHASGSPAHQPVGGLSRWRASSRPRPAPFEKVDVDPVTLDLIENGLRNARYEMDEVLFRTALSPGIREQHDEFPLIADPDGKMVVGQFGLSIPDFLDGFDDTIEEGDVLLTSDPYACGAAISHANDWLVVAADLRRRPARRLGVDVRAHVRRRRQDAVVDADRRAHDLRGGRGHPALQALRARASSTRTRCGSCSTRCACPTGTGPTSTAWSPPAAPPSRRVVEMCERFGTDTYLSALDALLQRNYDAMKVLLQMVFEEGRTLSFTDYICDDGVGYGPYELKLSLTRTGDKVHLDFTGSSPQAAGPINYYINENLTRMFFGIYMITVADPQILWNDGFYPLVDVTIPDGSYWKPKFPAALNGRNHGIGRVFDLFGGLLGQTNPALLNAAGFSSSPHFMYSGYYSAGERKGEWFQLYSIGFGGIPGRPLGDGPDGHSLWPSFVNIPCEFLESYYPLRIEKWETVADTGGAGLHRGGNGVDVAYVFQEPGTIAIHDDRWLTYPWGVNGGAPGRARHASGSSGPTAPARCCRASATTCRSRPATSCTSSPGAAAAGATRSSATRSWWRWRCGAGWSPPRAPAATASCVADDGTVDAEATETLRDQMRADRPGRAAGLRHGAADRGAARPTARRRPGCRRRSGRSGPDERAARGGVLRPGRLGDVARARGHRPGARLHRAGGAVRPARPGSGGGGDARRWSPPPGRRGDPVVWTVVRYAARPGGRRAVRAQGAGAGLLRRGRAGRLGRADAGPRSRASRCVVKQYASAFFGTSLAVDAARRRRGHRRPRRRLHLRLRPGHRDGRAEQRLPAAGGARGLRRPDARRCTTTTWPTSTPSTPTSPTCGRRSPTCEAARGVLAQGPAKTPSP